MNTPDNSIKKLLRDMKEKKPESFHIDNKIEKIETKEHLADFVLYLRNTHPASWPNSNLDVFLEAMEAFIRSIDKYYENNGKEVPIQPKWKDIANILYAASIYD